ncbi:MAG: aminoacyl-tRNA hydrolase [Planctomycetes bacterium]|nr:aminoacyl-tRNA hydrolase [Planctomycetota bacterium]
MRDSDLPVAAGVSVRAGELRFTACRSSGPGGQNVNKVSTRARLRFDLAGSDSLSDGAKAAIAAALGSRVGKDGCIAVSSDRNRSFEANRRDCLDRLQRLLRDALLPPKPRKATRPPASADARRLEQKRRRKARRVQRGPVKEEE